MALLHVAGEPRAPHCQDQQTSAVTANGCAWCGGGPLSREDLLPLWLAKVLADAFPSDEGYDFAGVYTTAAGEGPLRTFPQRAPELVVKAVCEGCNSGWMSALEGRTKPFLEPMVRGESVRLEPDRQITLAHWAAKVVALLDHYEKDTIVLGPTDAVQIHRAGQAPAGFHIRLAYRAEAKPAPFDFYLTNLYAAPAGTSSREVGKRADANAFSVTLGLGRVAIAIVGGPGIDNPERWRNGGEFPLMIWPPTMAGVEWPPQNPILNSRDELRGFHESFWVQLLNPEFPRPDAFGSGA